MIEPEAFDAFYKDARTRLLLQTYALTGDLPAARSAARDSFIVTWHHWRKVSRLPDPEAWVRPHAWAQAQRRHTARIWHRDKSLDPEAKATFEALGRLSLQQRKALVLDRFTTMTLADRARELGLTTGEAERQTVAATERFLEHREVGAEQLEGLCAQLEALVEDSRWPRASILRRAGAARRRTHTLIGAAAAVAAVLVTGTVVNGSTLEGLPLGDDRGRTASSSDGPSDPDPEAALTVDQLLTADELRPLVGGRGWQEGETSDNSRGSGRFAPCQQDRYADPSGVSTMVRTFDASPGRNEPAVTAVQYAELSSTTGASRKAWHRMLGWYAGCVTPRTQLMGTYSVAGVGDEARMFHLRSWRSPASTYVVGVARTGQVVTTTLTRTSAETAPDLRGAARLPGWRRRRPLHHDARRAVRDRPEGEGDRPAAGRRRTEPAARGGPAAGDPRLAALGRDRAARGAQQRGRHPLRRRRLLTARASATPSPAPSWCPAPTSPRRSGSPRPSRACRRSGRSPS